MNLKSSRKLLTREFFKWVTYDYRNIAGEHESISEHLKDHM